MPDVRNKVIRRIDTNGIVTTFAGTGALGSLDGDATSATFKGPAGICVDSSANVVYVADTDAYNLRKISNCVVSTLAGSSYGFEDGAGTSAKFSRSIFGICADATGNVYVADRYNHAIRMVTSLGVVSTLAGNGAPGYADGLGAVATFNYPSAVKLDPTTSNLIVTDGLNCLVRMVTLAGVVTTLAGNTSALCAVATDVNGRGLDGTGTFATFVGPTGLAVDAVGNVYVSENNKIRKITPGGTVTTVAGLASGGSGNADGVGTNAAFSTPINLAMSSSGTLYVADLNNNRIRTIN